MPANLKELFVVDTLIAASVDGSISIEALRHIAATSMLIGVGDKLPLLGNAAKYILSDQRIQMEEPVNAYLIRHQKEYEGYVSYEPVFERERHIALHFEESMETKWFISQGEFVHQKQIIGTHGINASTVKTASEIREEEKDRTLLSLLTGVFKPTPIKADRNGYLFHFCIKHVSRDAEQRQTIKEMHYAVYADQQDTYQDVKAWMRKQGYQVE